jgi:DNA-binding response OmpR family regulator
VNNHLFDIKRSPSILLIDDDLALADLLREYVAPERFALSASPTGEGGIRLLRERHYALVILDVMLPAMGGFEVLEQLRRISSVPVLMLTTRGSTSDRVRGLRGGADDYLPKPFDPGELLERIRSILRRVHPREGRLGFLRIDDLELDQMSRRVTRNDTDIGLTGSEFCLLQLLLSNPGKVLTRERLVKLVLDRELSANDRAIDTLVGNLRKKLGPSPSGTDRIRSRRGSGYVYAPAGHREAV